MKQLAVARFSSNPFVLSSICTKASLSMLFVLSVSTQIFAANVSADTTVTTGTTSARTLAARGTDIPNVKDYGALLNGTTDDSTAFNAARAAAPANGSILVPPGGFDVTSTPTAGPSTAVLWNISGNSYTNGTVPVAGIGTDEIETFLGNGGKFIARGGSTASSGPLLRIDNNITHSGGTAGNTISTLLVNTNVTSSSGLKEYPWGITSNFATNGAGPGNAVAVVGYAMRSGTGGTGEIWGANFAATDTSGANSAATNGGALVGDETDVVASGSDNYGNGIRVGHDIVLTNQSGSGVASFGYGVRVGGANGNNNVSVIRAFSTSGSFQKGFTCDLGTEQSGGACFEMASGQSLNFTSGSNHKLAYHNNGLSYETSVGEALKVDDHGNARFRGNVTASDWFTAPSYTMTSLPRSTSGTGGRLVFCTDCIKPGEASGKRSGMPVVDDGHNHWVTSAGMIVPEVAALMHVAAQVN